MFQNTQRVRLDFLFWSFTWPLWFLTVAAALLGAVVWFGLGVMRRHRAATRAAKPAGTDAHQLSSPSRTAATFGVKLLGDGITVVI